MCKSNQKQVSVMNSELGDFKKKSLPFLPFLIHELSDFCHVRSRVADAFTLTSKLAMGCPKM